MPAWAICEVFDPMGMCIVVLRKYIKHLMALRGTNKICERKKEYQRPNGRRLQLDESIGYP